MVELEVNRGRDSHTEVEKRMTDLDVVIRDAWRHVRREREREREREKGDLSSWTQSGISRNTDDG